MIPFAKHNFMHCKYITAKIHNGDLFYCSADDDDREKFSTQFVVASSG